MPEINPELRAQFAPDYSNDEIDEVQIVMLKYSEKMLRAGLRTDHLMRYLLSELREAQKAIAAKHLALGGTPGPPSSSVKIGGGDGYGFFQLFNNSAIYWRRDLGAWCVGGSIFQKYLKLKADASALGYPTSDETATSDGQGRFNRFERGSIYWHPSLGAFEVRGAIHAKWQSLGAEVFGYPITDEVDEFARPGRYNTFRIIYPGGGIGEGSIYFSAETGAHAVYGAIRERWKQLGLELSYLGFPISDEMDWVDPATQKQGRISHFQRGSIGWTAEDQKVIEMPEAIIRQSGHIGVSSLSGWAELAITSAGTFTYRGHMHNSGFIGLRCTIASALRFQVGETIHALTVETVENMGGTISFDDRNEDWEESGYKSEIRTHWEQLRDGLPMVTALDAGLAPADFLSFVFLPLVGAGVVLAMAFGGNPPEGQKCTTSNWTTEIDGNGRRVATPGSIRCTP